MSSFLVFNRVYKLEIQSAKLVFSTSFVNYIPPVRDYEFGYMRQGPQALPFGVLPALAKCIQYSGGTVHSVVLYSSITLNSCKMSVVF